MRQSEIDNRKCEGRPVGSMQNAGGRESRGQKLVASRQEKTLPRWLMAAFALAMLVLLAGGAWFYRTQEQHLWQQTEHELQAIAQLKVNQIAQWPERGNVGWF